MMATQGVKYFLLGDSVGCIYVWSSPFTSHFSFQVFTRNGTLHERPAVWIRSGWLKKSVAS